MQKIFHCEAVTESQDVAKTAQRFRPPIPLVGELDLGGQTRTSAGTERFPDAQSTGLLGREPSCQRDAPLRGGLTLFDFVSLNHSSLLLVSSTRRESNLIFFF